MQTLTREKPGSFAPSGTSGDTTTISVTGCWTIDHANALFSQTKKMELPKTSEVSISLEDLVNLDTSGAWLLFGLRDHLNSNGVKATLINVKDEHVTLFWAIQNAVDDIGKHQSAIDKTPGLFSFIQRKMEGGYDEVVRITSLLGALVIAFSKALINPTRFRLPALVTHMMRTGLTAVPIIALMSFVIGAIIAQQGAYQLSFFGADILAVDFVSVLVTRDLGVLLTAIMVSGRSGSAYTAEIGSMKMREEIDALKVIGLDPVDVLLFPRILALVIVLPLLTVIADVSALLGAQAALWLYIDMSWEIFLDRARDITPLSYFLMGVVKAPFMALTIGLIAMSEGLKVAGSTESLSKHTTIAVVKSIFMVIVIDGVFAVISASLNY